MLNSIKIRNLVQTQETRVVLYCGTLNLLTSYVSYMTEERLLLLSLSQSIPIPSNKAPLVEGAMLATQNLVSFSKNISPLRPKQKFATPPGTRTLPIKVPPAFQTLRPSPHPEYTFPTVSHLIPSGMPVSATAKSRRLAKKSAPERRITSKA